MLPWRVGNVSTRDLLWLSLSKQHGRGAAEGDTENMVVAWVERCTVSLRGAKQQESAPGVAG